MKTFGAGTRVKLSAFGLAVPGPKYSGLGPDTRGTVTTPMYEPIMGVILDGQDRPGYWNPDVWETVEEELVT